MIVNGDDFGRDDSTNRGIIRAFEEGSISSTTLMANQPGFEHAVELAHEHGLERHVGLHLVLTQGRPLTHAIRRLPRFCDDEGRFRNWRTTARIWRLTGFERDALLAELRGQIRRVRDARLSVTHVDSHHQVHNEWAIGTCVIAVSRELAIPAVRLARNCGPAIGPASAVYKWAFNRRLRRCRLARTRRFGNAADWLHLQRSGANEATLEDFELMTHPRLTPEGELVDVESGVALERLLGPVAGIRSAMSYSGARRLGSDARRPADPHLSDV